MTFAAFINAAKVILKCSKGHHESQDFIWGGGKLPPPPPPPPKKKKERKKKNGKGEREKCMVGACIFLRRIASDQYSLRLHDSII